MSANGKGKSVADKLEVENKQMADRLQQLKLTLKKQKAQRGGKAKGVIWRSASITKSGIKTVEKGAAGRRRPRLPGSGGKRGGAAATAAAAAAPPSRRITTDQVAPLPPSQMPAFEAAPPPARPPSTSVNDPADMLELKGEESDVTPEEASGSGEEFDEDAGHAGFLAALNDWRSGGSSPSKAPAGHTTNPGAVAGCPNLSNTYHTCSGFCKSLVAKRLGGGGGGGGVVEGPAPRPAQQAAAGGSTTYEIGDGGAGTGTGAGGGLLDGPDYDEAASAAAFRAAVAEWRTGANPEADTAHKPKAAAPAAPARTKGMWMAPADVAEVQSFECQTEPEAPKRNVNTEIKFKTTTGLTYMEKLLLAKLRKQGPAAVAAENVPLHRGGAHTDQRGGKASPEPSSAAAAPAAYDPEGWLAPLPARGSVDELGGACSNGGLQISEVFADDSGASDDGAATPCMVDEPSSDEGDTGGVDYMATGPVVQYDARPLTASRKITITPEYGSHSDDADNELEEITIEEYFEEDDAPTTTAATANLTTPTRPTGVDGSEATPTAINAATKIGSVVGPPSSLRTAVVSASEGSDDSEGEEMIAAAMVAAEISAKVEHAAMDSLESSANGDFGADDGSPHRQIITPGMMHDFEEMEKMALI